MTKNDTPILSQEDNSNGNGTKLHNPTVADNSSKLIFGDSELCAQFLRDYIHIPLLKNVQAEDIEDVTDRFLPLFTAECDADTVKRIRIPFYGELYLISLIEHKTKVDYNVSMQLLKYMYFIWDNYEKEQKSHGVSSKSKGFRYPPILPIVYYEGKNQWTELLEVKDRIAMSDTFGKYIPNFSYELIELNQYSYEQILQNKNLFSIIAALNKTQGMDDFKNLPDISTWSDELLRDSPEHLRDILAKIIACLMNTYHYSEVEIQSAVEQVKEEKMARLWEHAKVCDIQEERRKARTEGLAEGRFEMICKLFQKEIPLSEIANLLDEDETKISSIRDIMEKHAPNYDIQEIYKEYLCKNSNSDD